jgi:hypothetical protein
MRVTAMRVRVDGPDFDRLTLQFQQAWSRRRLGRLLAAIGPVAALGLGAGAEAGKKTRKKKKKPRCRSKANPHWCGKAKTCVPACPQGKVFDKKRCTCRCAGKSVCCQCVGGSNPFCSRGYTSTDACVAGCTERNPNRTGVAFVSAPDGTTNCTAAGTCEITCTPDDCAGADACKGDPGSCAVGGLQCFQPLGGGPTRCGRPTDTTSCGCTSHQQCVQNHGPPAFCVQITGGACTCGGKTTFCATQLGGA